MTRPEPARRVWVGRVSCFQVTGLASLLLVASLLSALIPSPTAQAQSSQLASTSTGPRAEVVEAVPLVPTTKAQRSECQTFADHLRRHAPCPGLLPDPIPVSPTSAATLCPGDYGALGEGSCGPAGIQVDGNLFELSQSNFQVPPGYIGDTFEQSDGKVVPETSISGGPLGHFVFMSGTDMRHVMTNTADKRAAPVPSYCVPLNPSNLIRVHGQLAKLYQCGDASSSHTEVQIVEGHTLLVWNDAGITCEVSFHGHSQTNVDLDVAVANATVLVSPRKR
jgi:hypothetical protein